MRRDSKVPSPLIVWPPLENSISVWPIPRRAGHARDHGDSLRSNAGKRRPDFADLVVKTFGINAVAARSRQRSTVNHGRDGFGRLSFGYSGLVGGSRATWKWLALAAALSSNAMQFRKGMVLAQLPGCRCQTSKLTNRPKSARSSPATQSQVLVAWNFLRAPF